MITEKTTITKIQGTEEDASLYLVSRSLLTKMAEKYDVEPSKIVINMRFGKMVIEKHDITSNPEWETLEVVELPNYSQ